MNEGTEERRKNLDRRENERRQVIRRSSGGWSIEPDRHQLENRRMENRRHTNGNSNVVH
ncbi:MAG TPA: hypothetical protein QF517_02025 [Pseudomonadales bacterium]|nr:hypothetical protein [Pseudomonadales bacterium]MDP7316346.1 hypothetical protein [Pseudomonadales bacterium]MDP7575947.1 hypothetical protein [Pseudomonadales bacterium]HJL60706.1 hypothetical protein [Pseudomonadales bacterium]HJP52829.1 hypothetical protein [Pseudomonadales bacterium]